MICICLARYAALKWRLKCCFLVLRDTSAVNHISQKTEAALFSVIALLDTTKSVTDEIFDAKATSSFFDLCDLLVDKVYTRLLFDLLHLFLEGVSYYFLSPLLFPLCCPAGLLSLHSPISNHLHQSCFTREGFLLNALIGWTVYSQYNHSAFCDSSSVSL